MQKLLKNSFILLTAAFILGCTEKEENGQERILPILGNRDVEYKMVDGVEVADTIYPTVPLFSYINQDSVRVRTSDFKGKVFVADFFFSNCPSICPPMTTNMKRLNIMTNDLAEKVQFLSFSIDPKRDTPTRLKEYIKLNGIEAKNWSFLTGVPAEETHEMAGSYFSYAKQDDEVPGGFGHTSYFVLVDTKGYVRGIYDGLKTEAIDSLANDLRKLLEYEYNFRGSKKN